MKSPIVKRSIVIGGHKTSVSLEDAFWRGLKEIARAQRVTLSKMVADIDKTRSQSNLSSAIRLFVLDRLRNPRCRGRAGWPRPRSERRAERMFHQPEHQPRLNARRATERLAMPVAAAAKIGTPGPEVYPPGGRDLPQRLWSLSDGDGTIVMVNGEAERSVRLCAR